MERESKNTVEKRRGKGSWGNKRVTACWKRIALLIFKSMNGELNKRIRICKELNKNTFFTNIICTKIKTVLRNSPSHFSRMMYDDQPITKK